MRTKSRLLVLSLLFYSFTTFLNAQQSTFTKVYYDGAGAAQGYSVLKTFDQKFLIAGEKDGQALALKLDQSGNILWSKKFGISAGSRFNSMTVTHDSSYLMVGSTVNVVTGGNNIFCVKITSSGDTLWTRTIEMWLSATALSVEQTSDHGFILAGSQSENIPPYSKIAVMKLDSSGHEEWNHVFTSGTSVNRPGHIRQTADGGYILIGGLGNNSPLESAACLIRLKPDLTISWAKKVYSSITDYYSGCDVVLTSTGYLSYITGNSGTVILKTDFSGNFLWSRYYNIFFPGVSDANPSPKLHPTSDGGYIFTSSGWGLQPMVKIDSAGILQWSQTMFIIATDVVELYDHGYLVLGNGPIMGVIMGPTDHPQIGIIKTDSIGNSSECTMSDWVAPDTCTVSLIPVTYTSSSGALLVPSHPAVTDAPLSIFEGCVAVIGSIADPKSDGNPFLVSPNPSNGLFEITLNQPDLRTSLNLRIYNVMGEMVYQSSSSFIAPVKVDLSSQPSGIYYIQGLLQGKSYPQKIMICH